MNSSPDGDKDEPEPNEDVHLFVDDVHGKNAKTVLVLDRSRGTVFVKGAFGDLRKRQ